MLPKQTDTGDKIALLLIFEFWMCTENVLWTEEPVYQANYSKNSKK